MGPTFALQLRGGELPEHRGQLGAEFVLALGSSLECPRELPVMKVRIRPLVGDALGAIFGQDRQARRLLACPPSASSAHTYCRGDLRIDAGAGCVLGRGVDPGRA